MSSGGICQGGLDRVRAIQVAQSRREDLSLVTVGCDWYVNSAEYGYCFHNMLSDLDGHPMQDKEICKMLLITPAELKAIYASAIEKLKAPENAEFMLALAEVVAEKADDIDQSLYMPYEFHDKIEEQNEIAKNSEEPYKPGKRGPKPKKIKDLQGMGMPVHHSKRRLDIYFGYAGKDRKGEIEENKKRIKKKDPKDGQKD